MFCSVNPIRRCMRTQFPILPIILGGIFSTFSILGWAEEEIKPKSAHHDSVAHIVKQEGASQENSTFPDSKGSKLELKSESKTEVETKPEAESRIETKSEAKTESKADKVVVPVKTIPPLQVLRELEEGNRRFIEGVTKSAGKDGVRRKEILAYQNPSAVVLSCSDSRVPPELVFDRGLGEIYTVRVAGNILGAASVASIEYAVARLGVRLIVILGHESCELIKAALTNPAGKTAGSPDLDSLISSIYVEENTGRALASVEDDSVIRKSVIFNINGVADRLLKRSLIIRKYVQEGKVKIVRAIYGLESGKVDFWGTESLK
jgi:carbonic anhydrase